MGIYYNEFNPESAAIISQFMEDGLIPKGKVDTRPIQEIDPDELKRYTQCHFFAGIAGWTFALQLANWPGDRPVWTGSCPCQPFSSAGRQKGKADERHLWPIWLRLISECRPATIFGEQVASAVAYGWLDDVYEGLEALNYAIGAAVLPASSVGAPHKRERLWFVAHSCNHGTRCVSGKAAKQERGSMDPVTTGIRQAHKKSLPSGAYARSEGGIMGDTQHNGHPWESGVWIDCPDGKKRLVEPSIPLLVDGFQHRKPILHALGNAIVPQVAAEFIKASM